MPYTIVRDGDEYCVHKKDPEGGAGERVACHDTREGAQRQIAAIEANEKSLPAELVFFSSKEDKLRRVFLIASNAYRDREEEIVSTKALQEYVKDFTPGRPLLFWHGGDAIGEIVEAGMVGPFLIEIGKELPNRVIDLARKGETPFATTVKEVWDLLEKYNDEWGASIGFGVREFDKADDSYESIVKIETSILPLELAANIITLAHIL